MSVKLSKGLSKIKGIFSIQINILVKFMVNALH
jgi:hypothetical protein